MAPAASRAVTSIIPLVWFGPATKRLWRSTFLWRVRRRPNDRPTILAFDLDPGVAAEVLDCAQVALWVREVLDAVGLEGFVKTSGSKGLQLYVPLNNDDALHQHASSFALAVAQLLAGCGKSGLC